MWQGQDFAAAVEPWGDTPGKVRVQENLSPAAGPVCVTGASGFVALELVRQLLEKGYTVIGTVRSESDPVKMGPLRAFQEKFGDKLKIVAGVDLFKAETFDAAVKGCVGVFHTASPFHMKTDDAINDLVKPAVDGTTSCLKACKKDGGVKRVIVTSSTASITNPGGGFPGDYKYTSKDWNKSCCPDADGKFPSAGIGYCFSKVAAEKAAWDFVAAEDCPFDLACINPPLVIGKNWNKPAKVEDLNTSSGVVLSALLGTRATRPGSDGFVDVADVARGHIAAYEHQEAGGRRFLCAADEVLNCTSLHARVKQVRPDCPVQTAPPAEGVGLTTGLDNTNMKSLGDFKFTPLTETLRVQAQSLSDLGFLKPKPHAMLVFSRHGESEWNLANRFTGWVDVGLSEKGVGEAKAAGALIKEEGIVFDQCYSSFLKRAIGTCNLALESADQLHVRLVKSWRLNERMYGGLTGLDKKETVVKHGAEQVLTWRRSFDLPPPDIDEDSPYNPKKEMKYRNLDAADIPKTESLKTVIDRVMPFWESDIVPNLKAGKTVFVAAHGNSIRAILKYIEGIPDDVIPGLEIPTGTPLVYELDADLKPMATDQAVAPLKFGRYLGDAEKIKAAAEAVKNQTKV